MITVDVSVRLRQAILTNDTALVKRILSNNPTYLQNSDYADKCNTSLHLAAAKGFLEIAEYLVSLGHDGTQPPPEYLYLHAENNRGPSFNTDGHTPLHLAASHSHADVVELLCVHFPQTINQKDSEGCSALHLASRAHPIPLTITSTLGSKASSQGPDDTSSIETLLNYGANVHAQDSKGNTCLHFASAWGNLKALRILMQAGADPLCSNHAGWTPEYFSLTVQAEVYYRNLVAEYERRRADDNSTRLRARRAKGGGGVRLVTADDGEANETESYESRSRAGTDSSQDTSGTDSGLGISLGKVDSWK